MGLRLPAGVHRRRDHFISVSDGSFWGVIVGLLQAIVWPVYAVYHVLLLGA